MDTYEGKQKLALEIAQGSAALDIIFAGLGWTPSALGTVLLQITSRLFFVFLIFPICPKATETDIAVGKFPWIQIAVFMWAITEPVRSAFYAFKFARNGCIGDLRYNMFWIVYPLGVGAEMFSMWTTLASIRKKDIENRPFTYLMPNKVNFELQFEYIIYIVFACYIVFFPVLYKLMIVQRKKFYEKKK